MKKYVLIGFISLFYSFYVKGQELVYFEPLKGFTETMKSFYPKNRVSPDNVSSTGWKFSLLKEGKNIKSLKEVEKNKFQEESLGFSTEDLEILKTVAITYYVDKDFKVETYMVKIPNKYVDKFPRLEKKIYDYACKHEDMSYLKPYFIIPEDFTGSMIRLGMLWWLNDNNP